MAKTFKDLVENYKGYFYFVFRVFVGALFMQHGLQKLFGMFGGQAVDLISLMGLAGIVELSVGVFLVLGLLVRLSSFIGAVQMLTAYFMAHVSNGLAPIVNKGELALLFFATFLVMIAFGYQKWGLDGLVFRKKKTKKKVKKK